MALPATVLVVDDDLTNIAIVAQLLEPEFEVSFATSGKQALELIPSVMPDLVLLDVIMPDMDGYAVCEMLKADPATLGIPIIFITGLQESESEWRGLEMGAADYVTKPFNPNVVRARVRNQVDLKRARDQLLSLADTDGLTGLANRRSFDVALEREHKRLARSHGSLALIMLDLDHFKAYNDLYGHVAGDDCLRRVAEVLMQTMQRPADVAARYGGEEFACVLPETTAEGALAIAKRLHLGIALLAIPHAASSTGETVSASIGVASEVCVQENDGEAIVRAADAFLYQAKLAGRNRIAGDRPSTYR